MATILSRTYDLPTSPDRTMQLVSTPEYYKALGKELGYHDYTVVEVADAQTGGTTTTTYAVDTELPAWATKFFQPRNSVTETRMLEPAAGDGSRAYAVKVKIDAVPVEITGRSTVVPVGSGARGEISLTIKANIPVVGKRLEELVLETLSKSVEGETRFAPDWIARR